MPPANVCTQHTRWVFTLHDPTWMSPDQAPAALSDAVSFMTWQLEACPQTGRRHLQGCLRVHQKVTLNGLKRKFGTSSVHLEPMHGSLQQAIDYCNKEDTRVAGPWTVGVLPQPGEYLCPVCGVVDEDLCFCCSVIMEPYRFVGEVKWSERPFILVEGSSGGPPAYAVVDLTRGCNSYRSRRVGTASNPVQLDYDEDTAPLCICPLALHFD